jgi:hypothetical protein
MKTNARVDLAHRAAELPRRPAQAVPRTLRG